MLKFKFEAMKCLIREADEQLISRTPICREQNVVVSKWLTFLGNPWVLGTPELTQT